MKVPGIGPFICKIVYLLSTLYPVVVYSGAYETGDLKCQNRTPTPVYLDPGMHSGLEVKVLSVRPGAITVQDHYCDVISNLPV